MAEIAKASDVRIGQIYKDFSSKEDIIAAIVKRDIDDLLEMPSILINEAHDLQKVASWVEAFICRKMGKESCALLSHILSETARSDDIASILEEALDDLTTRLADALQCSLGTGVERGSILATVDLVLTAAGALQYQQLLGRSVTSQTVKVLCRIVADRLTELLEPLSVNGSN